MSQGNRNAGSGNSSAVVRGKIHLIEETKTFGAKGFRKRLVVLEQDNDGRFTNYIPVDFLQDACDSVDQLNVGDELEVTYRLSGRKWQRDPQSETKFFLNAEAVSFKVLGNDSSGSGAGRAPAGRDPNLALSEAAGADELDEGDVPF